MRQGQLLKESSTSQASAAFPLRIILSNCKLEIPGCLGSRHLYLQSGTNSQHMTELVGQIVSSAAELHEISPDQGGRLDWKATAGRREYFLPMDLFSSFDPGIEKGKINRMPGLVAGFTATSQL